MEMSGMFMCVYVCVCVFFWRNKKMALKVCSSKFQPKSEKKTQKREDGG